MAGETRGLVKGYTPGAKVEKFRILKFGASDGVVIKAAAATDLLIGVSTEIDSEATDSRCDGVRSGLTRVLYGGTITRGQYLTSDANGKAVVAAPAQGANVYTIGQAEVSGVDGDIGWVLVCPGVMQGA